MLKKSFYSNCRLCPRQCGVDRGAGQRGVCGETAELRLAFAGIHKGEEPPAAGAGGSGTVFVSGCNLGCIFCQNHQISQKGLGRAVQVKEFAGICIELQERGAENINIVTGSHAAPALVHGIEAARKQGLFIPVLWNSSGYDGTETLEMLKDVVDVYLPDLKTLDRGLAAEYFNAPDYPEHAAAAILKMIEYRELCFGLGRNPSHVSAYTPAYIVELATADAIVQETLISGVMVRHLVLPAHLEQTRQVLAWFAENCKGRALLSLMMQYTPVGSPAAPDRFVSEDEYEAVLSMMDEFGIEDGYCQELVTGSDWLPDFTRRNPFSSKLSVPVWRIGDNE